MFFKRSSKKEGAESSLAIELSPPQVGTPCSCCGGVTPTLTRFVYRGGAAYAVYYVAFSDNHPDRVASAVISVGEWGEESTPEERVAFCLRLWSTLVQHNVEVVEPADVGWPDAHIIGKKLTRSEALAHARLQEVFSITDCMFTDDTPLLDYLQANETPSNTGD